MFIFFFLIKVVSAVDETIVDCAKDVLTTAAGAPMLKKRPTIDPSNCFDLDVGSEERKTYKWYLSAYFRNIILCFPTFYI